MPWLSAFRLYLSLTAVANLVWETAQLPLYTLWRAGSAREIAIAIAHCTAGDLVIAASALLTALALAGHRDWPLRRFRPVMVLTLATGFVYTGYSEWMNTAVRMSWAYSDLMPIVPVLNLGLSPFLQWIVIPAAAFAVIERVSRRSSPRRELD